MFATNPKKLSITLITYIALVLALSSVIDAKGYADVPLARRDHGDVNRMLRKRAAVPPLVPVVGAGSNPNAPTTTSAAAAATTTSAAAATTSSSPPATSASTTSSASESATSAATSDPASSSSSVPPTSSTTSTSSAPPSSLSTAPPSTSTVPASQTAANPNFTAAPATTAGTTAKGVAHVTITSSAAAESSTSSALPQSTSSKVTRATITVLIVIVASVGGAAIIWTIIRKWKFRPSAEFEDRMQPINWQPADHDDGLPGHRRRPSNASSFHSGGHGDEANFAGRGMGAGYGATSDSGHNANLPPLPEHDFTAGPATLAPGAGYADLARGPSPQPQMQELARGPSMNRGEYDYGVPLHHQSGYDAHDNAYGGTHDAYDYNGAGVRY
ncbi:hypothetical protein JAAARDRAFT_189022 [Jaapia argillacea MUCL 33604]|uniref:Mid2 domain-containing protein n=1 Tax=Jaapia argillacea MUCL 33604 TaxID=933084 RepID=A0A067QLH2_9AGAM|nr:hypothetical protein JAAARDRAFT_189022 [Jaapia argillacea MUCL 33604]